MRAFFGQFETAATPLAISPRCFPCWRPGGNFVVFCRHDGLAIPSPGIVILGRVDSGIELFDVLGPVEVMIERIE
jgi:hypothetical protein